MKDADPRTIRLEEYRPPAYTVDETHLTFDIADGATTVTNRMAVRRAPATPADTPLVLDGSDMELLSVAVDGVALGGNQYRCEAETLTLFGVPERAEVTLVTRIEPEANTALEGLYKSGGMYCTQCEAEGFRKITYYPDRPDVLARFTTTIIADAQRYPVLLSNGNRVADDVGGDGRRIVTWQDPYPKPSYLFALVAGDLALLEDAFETRGGRRVVLQIYSEPHNIDQCHYAMDVLKRAMRWDEQAFGREYDLDVFMIVAVDDFNMGAMENKGLNIFNTSCVLASPDTATDQAYQRVEAVVAHEYFHNWSGNRVTCRDWFQLSLKEGFTVFRDAEFSSDMNSRTVKRIEDVSMLRAVQFAEDSGPLAHPVRPASYIEISNFYTPTVYEKGAEVVRMLHTLLGQERFRRGSDLYFDRHDGQAATIEDFIAAMADASELDLEQFQRWYAQAGTPVIEITETWQEGTLTLAFSQRCPATPGQPEKAPFHVPVLLGLLDGDGHDLVADGLGFGGDVAVERRAAQPDSGPSLLVHLREPRARLTISGLSRKPVVSALRGFSAPVRLEFPRPAAELGFLAAHDTDGFARWDALRTLVVDELDRMRRPDAPAPGEALLTVFGELLARALASPDEPEPKFLLAAMLTLPDEGYLFELLPDIEVDAVCGARDRLQQALAARHLHAWRALYAANQPDGPFSPDARAMARRSLKHAALAFLSIGSGGGEAGELLEQQYRSADNLTDRRGALWEAVRHPGLAEGLRKRLLDDFFERWQRESLVVNLWFSLQAASPLTDASGAVALAAHPAFDARNPNKLRALYGGFGQQNHRNFHARDGSGYRFLGEAVARLDASNPQVASRLVLPLTRWRRYDVERQRLMRGELTRLAAAPKLSRDLFEVVTKSLPASEQ